MVKVKTIIHHSDTPNQHCIWSKRSHTASNHKLMTSSSHLLNPVRGCGKKSVQNKPPRSSCIQRPEEIASPPGAKPGKEQEVLDKKMVPDRAVFFSLLFLHSDCFSLMLSSPMSSENGKSFGQIAPVVMKERHVFKTCICTTKDAASSPMCSLSEQNQSRWCLFLCLTARKPISSDPTGLKLNMAPFYSHEHFVL